MAEVKNGAMELRKATDYEALGASILRKLHEWKPSAEHQLEILVDHDLQQIHMKWSLPNET